MITYDELKTALTDISNICRMTNCDTCPLMVDDYDPNCRCMLSADTPNNWFDNISTHDIELFAQRGARLVKEGYIDE